MKPAGGGFSRWAAQLGVLLGIAAMSCSDDSTGSGASQTGGAAAGAGGQGAAAGQGGAGASTAMGGAATSGGGGVGGNGQGGAGGEDPSVPPPCPPGTTEIAYDAQCASPGPAPSSALAGAIAGSTRGDTVDAAGELDGATCMPVRSCSADDAPTLIFSDEPEYVASDGVLYAEQITAGRYRVYLYHVNDGAARRRFTAVALNETDNPVSLTVHKLSFTAPSSDYLAVGQDVARGYLTGPSKPTQVVPPHTRVVVDDEVDQLVADPNELTHALFDVFATGPLKLSIVSVGENADAAQVTAGLSLLPNTQLHVRGTFPHPDRLLLTRHTGGLQRLRLGGNLPFDPDLAGTSFVDGGTVTLAGNFGSQYDVRVVSPPTPMTLLLNPRAGAWTGAMDGSAGLDQNGGALTLPAASASLGDADKAIGLGRYTSNIDVGLRLLTGGSSSLPVHVVAVPGGG